MITPLNYTLGNRNDYTNVIIKNGVINCHTQTQQPQNKDNNLLNDILGNNIDDGNGSKAVQTIGDDMGDDINNDLQDATKGGDCCILM
ncbi:MAG: hypothetical protein HRU35_06985 [Rickettsiaceae bacterium]|nr:hypothetical protein [Rickettsiaceae bacterium]